MTSSGSRLSRKVMRRVIEEYFAACNAADYTRLVGCFTPDAVHYFPAGSPFRVFRSADAIARGWIDCVQRFGSQWRIDDMLIDVDENRAVIEWTHFQPKLARYVRGDEWYLFDDRGLIKEIRAYYACPASQNESHELGHYPYAERGYSFVAPSKSEAT